MDVQTRLIVSMLHKSCRFFRLRQLGKVLSILGGGETLARENSALFHKKLQRRCLSLQTDDVFPITP
jgi:hypothetical protein